MAEEVKNEEAQEATAAEEAARTEEKVPEKPLDKMTAKELREVAMEIPGVQGVHAMKKDELLAIIKEYRGIKDEEPARRKTRKTRRPTRSVKELKEMIARLKAEKAEARQARDGKKVEILRRRINRMKKQTRKVAQG
ncbi:MAG: transcription termination factor Rho [Deltaproteobacteria bacterium]|nr:transcription termination factor Rho [Deltaproteobacteria bacterium]MBW1951377.1 transcription termination factor Rho [Deltaproteobacteria bacterium]MBW2347580.1 transcription termination factor Rho [Deltaproteobacteria bacterium]